MGSVLTRQRRYFMAQFLLRRTGAKDYGERRFISIGALSGIVVLVVAHTDRRGKIRIISARKANKTERGIYYEHFKEAT
jgi:uncharacterized DUF497 family protein